MGTLTMQIGSSNALTDACRYPNFVGKQMVLEILMEAMRSSSDMDQGGLVLLNSVLAIGCRNALRKHRLNTEKHSPITATRPLQYFQCALIHHNALSTGPPSLLKLQVSYSVRWNDQSLTLVHRA